MLNTEQMRLDDNFVSSKLKALNYTNTHSQLPKHIAMSWFE